MDDVHIILERHEQKIISLAHDVSELRSVQTEIRSMNETLVKLATELKNTNNHLARHERKLEEFDTQPKQRLQQIVTAIISALAGCLISTIIGIVLV